MNLNKEKIRELLLQVGYKLKEQTDGSLDLNPYVYDGVELILKHQDEILNVPNEKQLELDL